MASETLSLTPGTLGYKNQCCGEGFRRPILCRIIEEQLPGAHKGQ